MYKLTLSLFFVIATCYGDVPVTPPAPPRVLCGEMPGQIFSCLGMPSIISSDAAQSCSKGVNSCERMTCIFRQSGWLTESTVNKVKVTQRFEEYATEHPQWAAAVAHTKAACLAHDIPAQGYFLNCPAYDIMSCALASFIKNAQPSQWSKSAHCEYSRQYAASCPVCPQECFVAAVPIGACNACLALPRTP